MNYIPSIICEAEGCIEKALYVCEDCEKSYYCSDKHHRQNWYKHRMVCQELPVPQHARPQIKKINDSVTGYTSALASQLLSDTYEDDESDIEIRKKKQQELKKQEQKRRKEEIIRQIRTKDVIIKGAALKKQMDTREIDRSTTIFHYFNQNYQAALLSGRRVAVISQRISTEITPAICVELEHTNFIQTTKLLQDIQYLFDNLLLIRIFANLQKIQDIKQAILKLRLPSMNPKPKSQNFRNKDEMIQYSNWRKEVTHFECILRSLIQITSKKEMQTITIYLFEKYTDLIKQIYGPLELATTYFMIGHWYSDLSKSTDHRTQKDINHKNKRMQSAKENFQKCLQIRQKYGESMPLADVLLNLAIVQQNLDSNLNNGSIQKLEKVLQIRKNIIGVPSLQYAVPMQLLGRLYMLRGQFFKSFNILIECFKLQENMLPHKTQKGEPIKQRLKIQALIIFLYKNVQTYTGKYSTHPDVEELNNLCSKIKNDIFDKYQQFENYAIDDSDLVDMHFNLVISEQLFDALSAKEIEELSKILLTLQEMNYFQGLNFFKTQPFFTRLDKQKKTMILIANPMLDKKTPTNKSFTIKGVIK